VESIIIEEIIDLGTPPPPASVTSAAVSMLEGVNGRTCEGVPESEQSNEPPDMEQCDSEAHQRTWEVNRRTLEVNQLTSGGGAVRLRGASTDLGGEPAGLWT